MTVFYDDFEGSPTPSGHEWTAGTFSDAGGDGADWWIGTSRTYSGTFAGQFGNGTNYVVSSDDLLIAGCDGATGNPAAVWDSSYRLILHMADATIARVDDSTANGNDAIKGADAQPNQVDGKIGWGQLWNEDSASEWLRITDHASLDTGDTFTASIWVNYSRGGSPNGPVAPIR